MYICIRTTFLNNLKGMEVRMKGASPQRRTIRVPGTPGTPWAIIDHSLSTISKSFQYDGKYVSHSGTRTVYFACAP